MQDSEKFHHMNKNHAFEKFKYSRLKSKIGNETESAVETQTESLLRHMSVVRAKIVFFLYSEKY